MASLGFSLFFLFIVSMEVESTNLPSYITPCKVRAPDFSQCAVKSGNAAIPSLVNGDKKLGAPSFNPLFVPFVEFSSGDLGFNATNVSFFGVPNLKVTDLKVDLNMHSVAIYLSCPEIELDFDYNVKGKLASLPLEGHGKGKLLFYEVNITYSFVFQEYEKKGKKHANITGDHLDIHPIKSFTQLDDLFRGNKALGDNTNKFINENWEEVLNEFKPALSQIVGSVVRSVFNPMAKKVPLNEIFPDY